MGRTCTMGSLPCSRQSTESSTQWVTQQARSRISMTSGKVGGALRSRMLFCVPRALASSSPVQPNKFSVQVRSGQVRSGQVRSGQVKSTSGERAGRLQPRRQHYGYQEDRVVGECGSASTQARQRGSSPSVTEQMPPMRSESVGFCKHHTPHTHLSHRCALEDGCDAHKRTRGGFRAGTGRNDLSLC